MYLRDTEVWEQLISTSYALYAHWSH